MKVIPKSWPFYNFSNDIIQYIYGSDHLNVENNGEAKTRVELFSLAYNVNYIRITNIGTNETQKRDCCKKQNLSIHTEHIVDHFEVEKSMTKKGSYITSEYLRHPLKYTDTLT